MVPVNLCIPTLNRYDLLRQAILSAEAGNVRPNCYWIIDNGGSLDLSDLAHLPINIHRPGRNLGVGPSWNWFLHNLEDYIIIMNDDIKLHMDTIQRFVQDAESFPEKSFFCIPHSLNAWSMFLQRRSLFTEVGAYDEVFWPGYFEDNDYHRRMKLKGFDYSGVDSAPVEHFGSATIKAFTPEQNDAHHRNFQRNQQYYIAKWGGLPGHERFDVPFNGLIKLD